MNDKYGPPHPTVRWVFSDSFFTAPDRHSLTAALLDWGSKTGNLFAADDMVLFGRSQSYWSDPIFMAAFRASAPDPREMSLVWRKYTLYWAARQVQNLSGDFVEAGCHKGASPRVICNALDFKSMDRTYWLYDAFDDADPQAATPDMSVGLEADVRARFADTPNVRIVAGRVPGSFAKGEPQQVALLHIDMNNEAAETATLAHFWDRMPTGGIVLFDDYGWGAYWNQKQAHDRFAAAHGRMILEMPTGQGLLIK